MNSHTMKRTCDGCRAYETGQGGTQRCWLGYEMDDIGKPLTPCPKPKTYRDYIYASNNLRKPCYSKGGK